MHTDHIGITLDVLGCQTDQELTVIYDIDPSEVLGRPCILDDDYGAFSSQDVVILMECLLFGVNILDKLDEDQKICIMEEVFPC